MPVTNSNLYPLPIRLFHVVNMINTERDVALLRSKGLIKNLLSSDLKLAKLVNSLHYVKKPNW